MKAVVVYESIWGCTRSVAQAIAQGIGPEVPVLSTTEATRVTIAGVDLLVAGGPVHGFTLASETSRAGIDVTVGSGTLIGAAAGNWGTSGSNGGTAVLTADDQSLTGDIAADNSSVILALANGSSLSGAINADTTSGEARLPLDASSTWIVTADSYLTSLALSGGISGTTVINITGNGHTVYHDAGDAANSGLGGKTYTLGGGGTLKPIS